MGAPRLADRRAPMATALGLALAVMMAVLAAWPGISRAAGPCGPPVTSVIACENTLPGDPQSDWQVDGAGDQSIQGFATSMSVNVGQTINFKINTPATAYHIDILRLGYYQGNGARKIVSAMKPTASLPQSQPACLTDASSGLIDCGNWAASASWSVPSNAVSGVYIAHLVRNDTGGDSLIPFVVRNDSSNSDVLVQTSDATWEAYNTYGGNSLYQCTVACPPGSPNPYKGANAVSYNRPFHSGGDDGGRSWLLYAEWQMIMFLEQNGYNVSYTSEVDVGSNGPSLLSHKLFIASGHDEYWSASQRANVTAARDAGVSLAFFSGNEMFWKTRWSPSQDGTNTPNRTLVSYKETHYNSWPVDSHDPPTWTGTWRDPRFSPPSDGGNPENALTGQLFDINSGTSDLTVPSTYSKLRLWRNTAVANLAAGQSRTLAPGVGTLGYEWDLDADNGFRPAGLFDLSSTTVSGVEPFLDYGTTVGTGTATHHLTLYRVPSGALVFGAGTVQWAWGLSSENPSFAAPDPVMEQATINLFADMGAQPATLVTGLSPGATSTDTTPPTSTIASPTSGSSLADGTPTTITGNASDSGGVVAGVEISTDGGVTWHPATVSGAAASVSWSYAWVAHGSPSATVETRAVDDSGNVETPSDAASLSVTCPCSLFGPSAPATADSGDPTPVEVGVKFTSDKFGTVSGIRFYKASTNTGTHVGSLWTIGGQRLASATFSNETPSGWQTVTFATPVTVSPGTTYVASYFAPNGHYSATNGYFYPPPSPPPLGGGSVDSPPLHALRNVNGATDGVYAYGASGFPTSTFGAANYWVDVQFSPSPPPGQVTNAIATGRNASANVSWSTPTGGGSVATYTVTPYIGATAQTPVQVSGPATSATVPGLTQGTSYTFTVQASNPNGSGPESAPSNAVSPTGPTYPWLPTNVTASAATSQAFVSWTPPADTGGSPITRYTVTPYIGSTAQTPVQVNNGAASSTTITGLANATRYAFTVAATNSNGTGPASLASNAVVPQNTIFDLSTPATADAGDGSSVELGVKFKADSDGKVSGIRFYKSAANSGTHIGSLWNATGTLLASATFTSESTAGWQTVTFASPVAVTAGSTYVAGYFAPNGHYAAASGGFGSSVDNPPLHALSAGTSANGVYAYSTSSTYPTGSYNATNYWVDVLYLPDPPGQVTNASATPGFSRADVSWTAPTTGGAVASYTVTPYIGSQAQSSTTVTGSPPATSVRIGGLQQGNAYTFTIQASNSGGSGPASAQSNSVTPTGITAPSAPQNVSSRPASNSAQVSWDSPDNNGSAIRAYTITPYIGPTPQTPVSVSDGSATSATVPGLTNGTAYTFTVSATNGIGAGPASAASSAVTPEDTVFDFNTPPVVDAGDGSSAELGVKFTADSSGQITGVRFYKAAANLGTHVGSLWSSSGQLLSSATFTNETASGWQAVLFANPVTVSAGTTYVAGYFAPSGHYSVTSVGLSSAFDNAPLHALADGVSADGVYAYSGASTYPANTYNATNYWVDVLFQPTAPDQVTNVTATAGLRSATVNWSAPATGGATAYDITPYIGSTAQTPSRVTGSPPATAATIGGLQTGTAYTFTVQASNANGAGPVSAASSSVTPTGPTVPSAPANVIVRPATSQAQVSWSAPADGGSAITGYTITPYIGAAPQSPVQVNTGSATSAIVNGLTNGTTYTFTVSAANAVGNGAASTTSSAVVPQDTIFDFATPAVIDSRDATSLELGVKFSPDVSGHIVGIRFYKAAANTGVHVGDLWSADGQNLASATFSNETGTGWQTVLFASPVAVTAGTTYVASYFAPNGRYSATSAAFNTAFDSPPLHTAANNVSPDGVYAVTSTGAFPTNSFNATNYWVDVLFANP